MINFDKRCKNKEVWRCHCGCKTDIAKYNRNGLIYYAAGHGKKGKRYPNENRNQQGNKNNNYKGGRIIDSFGYIQIECKGHPRATKKGNYVKEHILVMEKHLGRYLTKYERVHHINGNKSDNRIENLKLMTHGEHSSFHRKEELKHGKKHFKRHEN